MQPPVAGQATMPFMEAMYVPFHMRYGSLISLKRLQSDGPKCRRMLVDPGTPRKHAEMGYF